MVEMVEVRLLVEMEEDNWFMYEYWPISVPKD